MKTGVVATAAALALLSAAGSADAALVMFDGTPSISFADGTFSHHLSGVRADGFYAQSPFAAINGWGQNGEYIQFNSAVTLDSLVLGACTTCYNAHPTTFTVNLYDAASILLDSQSISGSSTEETLNFNRSGVTKVEFTFEGTDGTNPYQDGRKVAWFLVRDVAYSLGEGVPEPATWALMIGGFGLAGGALRRRRAREA